MPMVAQDDLGADAFLAGDETGGGVADNGDLERAFLSIPTDVEGAFDGLAAQFFQPAVFVLAEPGHRGAGDCYVPHNDSSLEAMRPLVARTDGA